METMILIAFLIGSAFVCGVLCMFLGLARNRTMWHFFVLIASGVLIGICVDNLLGLYDWIELGLQLSDWGATMFTLGIVLVSVVMIYNFITTEGQTVFR